MWEVHAEYTWILHLEQIYFQNYELLRVQNDRIGFHPCANVDILEDKLGGPVKVTQTPDVMEKGSEKMCFDIFDYITVSRFIREKNPKLNFILGCWDFKLLE